ncbi:conserved hypothetical protein [mine drainage metagenome]|uniref:Uncharacterized protein n=1 Tax=mine drainage metagenome TaxID=410659 RepID=A0A3P3ZQA9_9ZZZZ
MPLHKGGSFLLATDGSVYLATDRSLANLVALLRMNLFTHCHLMDWLDQPFTTSPDPQDNPQTDLAFV